MMAFNVIIMLLLSINHSCHSIIFFNQSSRKNRNVCQLINKMECENEYSISDN